MPRINIGTPVRFKCQAGCSNCCSGSGGLVIIEDDDIKRISKYLKISGVTFIKKYTRQDNNKTCLTDRNESDCIFLENHKCLIYKVRPVQCRTFPFWPQNLKSIKRWHMIMEECPGIGKGKVFTRRDIEDVFDGKAVNSHK